MAKKVVAAEIEVKTANSIADLKALKKQLKDTAAGSDEFKKLYNQIDDLEDKIKGTKNASSDWIDSLERAGGPLGALGASLNKAKVATQSFGGALKATGIGLFVAAIGGLVAAFSQSEGAMKKFEPLLIGMQKILNGILKALEPIIDGFIELATTALPYVSKAIGVAYSAITSFLQGLGMVGSAVKKFISGDFSGALDDAKKSVTDFGKRYEDANSRFISGTKEVTKIEKEELDKRAAQRAEFLAEQDRIENQRLQDELDAADKRKKAREKINMDPIGSDGLTVKEREARKAQELKDAEEMKEKLSKLNGPEVQEKVLDRYKNNLATKMVADKKAYDADAKLTEENRLLKVNAALDIADAMVSLGSIVGEQTAAGKALGIASALINTYIGASEVIRAKSVLPEPFGTIQKIASVAAIIATGLKTVRTITAVQVPGASGSGGVSIPSASSISAPLQAQVSSTMLNQNQVNQIGNVAARAFVVESDVSGNQERIQRLNRAARIN
jgi:hypothetical protein